ncbi:MAG: hypothetical protein A2X31_00855 [Elusimicrobia bacterium GWB2_63_22]|nr:MAG: hypothetical protein A2X31_00855 [Elusimicrobia bacterium GWB2_63_22]
MKNRINKAVFAAALLPLLAGAALASADVQVDQQQAGKPKAVSTSVDNASDSAFASDLKGAQDLLNGLSHERKLPPKQSAEYIAKEMERAREFFKYAKSTLAPHSLALVKMMKDPEGMTAKGKEMVEKDPASWQGYDYLATGTMLKQDAPGAIGYFEKALAAAPDFQKDWYRYMLAACYNAQKEPAKALETYEGIIVRNDNWFAVKNSYIGASMMLLGKDDAKAVAYFDKGFLLYTPGEQAVLKRGKLCGKFKSLEKGPAACAQTN